MFRSKLLLIIVVLAITPTFMLPAQEKNNASSIGRAGNVGILFGFRNLLGDILPYSDGVQSGIGAKYWVNDRLAARALLGLYFNSYTPSGDTVADTTTYISLSAGLEYHPKSAKLGPYLGGFAGMKMDKVSDVTAMGFYAGAMAGVEYRVLDCLSLFAEYQLRLSYDSKGLTVSLGDIVDSTNGAIIGLCVYF